MSNIKEYDNIDVLIDNIENDIYRDFDVTIYARGDLAETLIKLLILDIDDLKISLMDFNNIDFDEVEYEIAVFNIDGTPKLFVEPCWHEKTEYCEEGYYQFESDVAYVSDDCQQNLLSHINSKIIVFSLNN